MYAPVSDRRNEIWARRATVEQHRRRSALFGSRQPSCRTEQPEEYIGYDSLRSPLVPIDRRHFAKPFSVSQKLMVDANRAGKQPEAGQQLPEAGQQLPETALTKL